MNFFRSKDEDQIMTSSQRTQVLAEVKAKAEKASSAPKDAAMSAAALQKLERIHVMKCAKKITGSDKPRKLAPELRDKVCHVDDNLTLSGRNADISTFSQVLKCANDFMPPVQTKALLAQSAKELMSAAKTPAQKKDALAVLAKVENYQPRLDATIELTPLVLQSKEDSSAVKAAPNAASTPHAAVSHSASAVAKQAAAARIAKKAAGKA